MPAALLAGLLSKVGWSVVGKIGAKAAKALTEDSLLEKAIRSTSEAYPEIDGLSDTLRRWCESEAFRETIAKLKEGQRELTNEEIAQTFVDATGFYFGDQTNTKALEPLECFLSSIAERLYGPTVLVRDLERAQVLVASQPQQILAQDWYTCYKSLVFGDACD